MTFESDAATAAIRAQLRVVKGGAQVSPKRLVMAGRWGPRFGARSQILYVVAKAGGLARGDGPEAA